MPTSRIDTLDLGELLRMLRPHIWLIAGVTAITLAAAAVVLLREEPVYRATAVLRLADARQALAGEFEASENGVRRTVVDPFLSEFEIFSSRSVAGQVVDARGLRLISLTPGFDRSLLTDVVIADSATADTLLLTFTPERVVIRSRDAEAAAEYDVPLELAGIGFTALAASDVGEVALAAIPREAAIDVLLEHFDASPRSATDVIDVSYVADDPVTAQRVLNEFVAVFQRENAERTQRQSRPRREFLEHQIARTGLRAGNAPVGARRLPRS